MRGSLYLTVNGEITEALNQPIFTSEAQPPNSLFEEIDDENAPLFSHKNLSEVGQIPLSDVAQLLELFKNGKTFGSLIQIPPRSVTKLPEVEKRVDDVLKFGDLTQVSVHGLKPLMQQARLLARQYDAVVANPPYMGSKAFNIAVKDYIKRDYKNAKADLCVAFMDRGLAFTKRTGLMSMVTMQSWMFLSSFEEFRIKLMQDCTMRTMIHLGPHAFPEIGGQVVQVTAFAVNPRTMPQYRGSYRRLIDGQSHEKEDRFQTAKTYTPSNANFAKIPGSPVAYWVGRAVFQSYATGSLLGSFGDPRSGMSSCDSARFLRAWYEVDHNTIERRASTLVDARESGKKWFPYNKGGGARKWFGYCDTVINWRNDGSEMKNFVVNNPRDPDTTHWSRRLFNLDAFFKAGITWSAVSSSCFAVRDVPLGIIPGTGSKTLVGLPEHHSRHLLLVLNSKIAPYFLTFLSPTLNFEAGDVAKLPILTECKCDSELLAKELVTISKNDWDSSETSWDFLVHPTIRHIAASLQESQEAADVECLACFARMKELEERNSRIFIEVYGLQNELSPEVPDDQITLYRPDREEDVKRLLSYAIGCMMGRYSLDEPGLIYAYSGNRGFDLAKYKTFVAHDDGIIPITDTDWFPDDATIRLIEFIATAWPKQQLEENLVFIAESLGRKKGESSRDTIRGYLSQGFFKHHLSMYKRRPIYWKFTSGKLGAFECLVYLHRYHEGTLPRMRTEYVIPLLGRIEARIEQLKDDIAAATSTAHGKRLQKERDKLIKQQAELQRFDEKLRHHADRRIQLDLDDGVKVNYTKFGDLLAEVKAVIGNA